MQNGKSYFLTPEMHDYITSHSTPPDRVTAELIERTAELGGVSIMQIAAEQARLLEILTQSVGARLAVEVGTFTGLSALSIARGLAPGGRLVCCDVSEEWTRVAREFWAKAGVEDRIDLRLAPALDTLRSLPPDPEIDLAFIDADKGGYISYWEEIVPRTRRGGLVLVDNVLYFGTVADPSNESETTAQIRAFNDHAAADRRVELVMLAVGDGLTVARRL